MPCFCLWRLVLVIGVSIVIASYIIKYHSQTLRSRGGRDIPPMKSSVLCPHNSIRTKCFDCEVSKNCVSSVLHANANPGAKLGYL